MKIRFGTYEKLEKLSKLKKSRHQRNKHPKEQIERLAKIMDVSGVRQPIHVAVVKGEQLNEIAFGHGRKEAAKLNGWTEFPIVYQHFDTDEEYYAAVQSDNALALWAELDLAQINADLPDLGPDFDLDMLGIKDFSLEPAEKYEGKTDEDEVPESVDTTTKPGDLWILGDHRLLCGDATSIDHVERLMNGDKADMVFTDPPYGVSYESKTKNIANQSKSRETSKIKSDDLGVDALKEMVQSAFHNMNAILAEKSCYYIASPQGGELGLMMMMMQEANLPCRHMIIWVKNAPVFSMGRLDYDYKHEPILFGWSKNRAHYKSTQKGQWRSSVWDHAKEKNTVHPTMKPVALMENAIINSCPADGKVIDVFGGSGSTLIACEKTNRKCFMMEIDPHYCDVIVKRWENYTGQKAKLDKNN